MFSFRSTFLLFALASAAVAAPVPLARDQFLSQVVTNLSNHFKLEGELQLELLRPWSPPARVAETWMLEMLEYPSVPAASMLVRCRILADGVAVGDATLVLRAALWRDVWVARQPLVAGATFEATSLETRRVDMLRERDALPAIVGDRSYSFTRAVNAGRVLTWRDISRRPLVRKGNVVEVSAGDGRLLITMKALALESGAEGDTVTVRNQESRRDFAAMVVDENRVQVRF
jgi:flagella basal body P-ring formation protein FlgA